MASLINLFTLWILQANIVGWISNIQFLLSDKPYLLVLNYTKFSLIKSIFSTLNQQNDFVPIPTV